MKNKSHNNLSNEDKKRMYSVIRIIFISVFIVVLSTLLFYFINFNGGLSNSNSDWGAFGSFLGGLLSTIVGLFNLIILAYLTLSIINIEEKRNDYTIKNLARPLLNINFKDNQHKISISFKNIGLGPLIISDFKIVGEDGMEYKSFRDVIKNFKNITPAMKKEIYYDIKEIHDNCALEQNSNFYIFKVYTAKDVEIESKKILLNIIRENLNKLQLELSYSDIYNTHIDRTSNGIAFNRHV